MVSAYRDHGVERVRFCATSAARDAENSEEFLAGIRERTGVVPEVLDVTREVLIMSKAPGVSIREADLDSFNPKEREAIGRDLCAMLLHGFMVDGQLHADPHPGNMIRMADGKIAFIDFGLFKELGKREMEVELATGRPRAHVTVRERVQPQPLGRG